MREVIPGKQEMVKKLRTDHGDVVLSECNVTQVYSSKSDERMMDDHKIMTLINNRQLEVQGE